MSQSGLGANVVVTGLGVVAGLPCGIDRLAETLARAIVPTSDVDQRAGYHLPGSARVAVLIANVLVAGVAFWRNGGDSS